VIETEDDEDEFEEEEIKKRKNSLGVGEMGRERKLGGVPGSNENVVITSPQDEGTSSPGNGDEDALDSASTAVRDFGSHDKGTTQAEVDAAHARRDADRAKEADAAGKAPREGPPSAPASGHTLKHETHDDVPAPLHERAPTPVAESHAREQKHKKEEQDWLEMPGSFHDGAEGGDEVGAGPAAKGPAAEQSNGWHGVMKRIRGLW
jgi:hypothetical protein